MIEGDVDLSKRLLLTGWWLQNYNSHLALSHDGYDFVMPTSMDLHIHLYWNHPSLALYTSGL